MIQNDSIPQLSVTFLSNGKKEIIYGHIGVHIPVKIEKNKIYITIDDSFRTILGEPELTIFKALKLVTTQ